LGERDLFRDMNDTSEYVGGFALGAAVVASHGTGSSRLSSNAGRLLARTQTTG
jgi:hypothetical protein